MERSAESEGRSSKFEPAECRHDRRFEPVLARFIVLLCPWMLPAVDSALSHEPWAAIPEGRDISTRYLFGLANPTGNFAKKSVTLALISAIILLL